MPKGKRDYLFKRRGSENFWIKLRSPDWPRGTLARRIPTVGRRRSLALPLIAQHKSRPTSCTAAPRNQMGPRSLRRAACIPRQTLLAQLLEEDEDPDHVAGLKGRGTSGRRTAAGFSRHNANCIISIAKDRPSVLCRTAAPPSSILDPFLSRVHSTEVLERADRPWPVKNGDDAIFET